MCRVRAALLLLLGVCQSNVSLGKSSSHKKEQEATIRENRFPSVEERVKLYMSNWYVPSCNEYKEGLVRYKFLKKENRWPKLTLKGLQKHPLVKASDIYQVESVVEPDQLFYMDPDIIMNCANATFEEKRENNNRQLELAARVKFRMNMRMYCQDVKDSLLAALYHVQWETTSENSPPTLLQFGDNKNSHVFGNVMVPHIKKFRSAATSKEELARVTSSDCYSTPRDTLATLHGKQTLQPIVWKLATHRHYEKLYQVYREDTPWYKKKDMAVFRGQLTGSRDGYNKKLSDLENCQNLKRCRLVYNHANSTLIYAKLTSTRGRLPTVLNGVTLEGSKVNINTLLQYKGIIMIEGNDVASGLKWALLSQSVVLMPPPKHTSWAMEELLEPWVVRGVSSVKTICCIPLHRY
jgi:hypothetical protein